MRIYFARILTSDNRGLQLREALNSKLDLSERNIVFREVTKHRISRELDDNVWLRFLNTTTRRVYCIEMYNLPQQNTGNLDDKDDVSLSSSSTSTSTSTGTLTESTVTGGCGDLVDQWKSCNICFDEMPESDLICHIQCTAQLCKECKDRSEESSPGKCPVCLAQCSDQEWVQLDQSKGVKPPLRSV